MLRGDRQLNLNAICKLTSSVWPIIQRVAEINDILRQVITIHLDDLSHILLFILDQSFQERYELEQLFVVHFFAVPAFNFYSIAWTGAQEVLLQVVNDDGSLDVSADETQVFDALEALLFLAFGYCSLPSAVLSV